MEGLAYTPKEARQPENGSKMAEDDPRRLGEVVVPPRAFDNRLGEEDDISESPRPAAGQANRLPPGLLRILCGPGESGSNQSGNNPAGFDNNFAPER